MPAILEVHVVWHPGDEGGDAVFDALLTHFHGTPFSGLIGGAVEVYRRSEPWSPDSAAPRPLPLDDAKSFGVTRPRFLAVVPVLGPHLARAVAAEDGWHSYVEEIAAASHSEGVGVFPVRGKGSADGPLQQHLGHLQAMDSRSLSDRRVLTRELAQQIAQRIGDPLGDRLTVFISHTKRHSSYEEQDDVDALVQRVRAVIGSTHLRGYFDTADIQPGSEWEPELRRRAAEGALLAVRTDLYAGREWCQREFLIAKQSGMPIVTLNAVRRSEERGSFVMDHVPVVGYRDWDERSRNESIEEALNLLVDGALRRAIWGLHEPDLREAGFDWLPLNAPEPVTLIPWLMADGRAADADGRVLIMHPDPPLGPDEFEIVERLLELAGLNGKVDVLTPRTYASRGGGG